MILPVRPGLQPSYRNIARKLKMSPGTIRNRINRLCISGVIKGSSVFPNPNLLGLKTLAYTVDVSPLLKKEEALRKLSLVEGVFFLHDFRGSLAWALFFYEGDQELQRKLTLINEITGAEGILSKIPYPPCPESVTRQEAELMLHLLKNGFEGYGELAGHLGVSARTLKRRLSRLVENGVVLSLPILDFRAMSQCIPADILVAFDNPQARAAADGKILQAAGEFLLHAALWDVVTMCALILPNVSTASTIAEKVKEIDNTRMARVEIVTDHIDQYYILVDFMQRWMTAKGWKPNASLEGYPRITSRPSKLSGHPLKH